MGRGRAEKTKAMALRMSEERRHQLNLIAKLLPGRHTMTSVLEWSLDVAITETQALSNVIKTWSPHESDRFVLTADFYPETLTHDEKLLWQFIIDHRVFWPLHAREGAPHADGANFTQGFNFLLLRDSWSLIKSHMEGAPWDEEAFAEICAKHGVNPKAALTITDDSQETKQG